MINIGNMKTITIDIIEYNILKSNDKKLSCITEDIKYLLRKARCYDEKELTVKESIEEFIERHFPDWYDSKLRELTSDKEFEDDYEKV